MSISVEVGNGSPATVRSNLSRGADFDGLHGGWRSIESSARDRCRSPPSKLKPIPRHLVSRVGCNLRLLTGDVRIKDEVIIVQKVNIYGACEYETALSSWLCSK